METILSSVPLIIYQSCRVSTVHIPTFRKMCNCSPRYTISAVHPFPSFLFHVECLPQLEQVVPLDMDSNNKTTLCFQHCVAMSTKRLCIETIDLSLSSCYVKAPNSAFWSRSLKLRQDHFLETVRFVLTGLESLQTFIKLKSCVESCRHGLTHLVRVKLGSIYSNN